VGRLLCLWLLVALPAVAAEPVTFTSSTRQVAVLELFTSHGCSSCPPADAWLRRLRDDPRLWREIVPMAFHVDYWNGLGWRDRFSTAANSARQRAYRAAGGIRAVYTPGFVLAGHEWKGWFRHDALVPGPRPTVGRLSLVLDGDDATLRFDPAGSKPHATLAHVALLGFGLSSPIGGGENDGRTLREDFVVLGEAHNARRGRDGAWHLRLPERIASAPRYAVVAWLSGAGSPAPIQAVGGWWSP